MSNYALAGEVIDWITEPSGECDRKKLFAVLNETRERMYQLHEAIPLFDLTMCFEVQDFCVDCNACRDTYRGLTLPRDYANVEAMWYGDAPVALFSSWREWQQGMAPECNCQLQMYDLPRLFSSERDPLPGRPEKLRVTPFLTSDFGKMVVVRYVDIAGANRMEELPLQRNGVITEYPAAALAQGAGFSKIRTDGPITLSTETGRVLSLYAPDETVPSYKRIKIVGLPGNCAQVNVRGMRKYFPVYQDSDVVETNNRVAFAEMARFIRINSKVSKNTDDLRTMQQHAGGAMSALRGEKSRELGKSARRELNIATTHHGPRRIGGAKYGC